MANLTGNAFDTNDANSWLYNLTNQSDKSGDPNYKQNIADYDATTGLPVGGRYQGYNALRTLLPAEYFNLAKQYGFSNSLQDHEHEAVLQYINDLMNPQNMSNDFRQQVQGQAANQTPELQNSLLSSGLSQSGAVAGAGLHAWNEANRAANTYDANLFSPTGRNQRMTGVVNAIRGQRPDLNNLLAMHSGEIGTPRNATGAQVAGGLLGTGLSLFGPTGGMGGGMGGGQAPAGVNGLGGIRLPFG